MLIFKLIGLWLRTRSAWRATALTCALLLMLAPLIAGCSQNGLAQIATATANVAVSPVVTPTAGAPGASTAQATTTPNANNATPSNATPAATATPTDPLSAIPIFKFVLAPQVLVKRDALQLSGGKIPDMLFTVSEPADTITQETHSVLEVISYDSNSRAWQQIWGSEVVTGTASPLPAANRADGYNGGKLLRTNDSIFLLRYTTLDNRAHLSMWRWDANTRKGEYLKMVPASGGPERNADFEADLDVTVADLDNDGIYEVVADNISGTQTWKWDGSKYAPEVKR